VQRDGAHEGPFAAFLLDPLSVMILWVMGIQCLSNVLGAVLYGGWFEGAGTPGSDKVQMGGDGPSTWLAYTQPSIAGNECSTRSELSDRTVGGVVWDIKREGATPNPRSPPAAHSTAILQCGPRDRLLLLHDYVECSCHVLTYNR